MRKYYRRRRRSYSNRDNTAVMVVLAVCFLGFFVIGAILNFLADNILLVVLVAVAVAVAFGGYAIYKHIDKKYEKFIFEHSIAIKKILEINSRYHFEKVPNLDMHHSYDNPNFYIDISPLDYLTYQLVDQQSEILRAIDSAERNKKIFLDYLNSLKEIQEFDKYDTEELPPFEKTRKAKEQKLFDNAKINPVTSLTIQVIIGLTNINGAYRAEKSDLFNSNEIKQVIEKLTQKNGVFYTNEDVWQSICRVERGKVTNRIRFAVYNRDGNRCRRCGSTYDLEIDHIYPISKGGKSNFGNLQTLCHTCNSLKSNKVEYGRGNKNAKGRNGENTCAYCGAALVLRNGKNGEFYGCSNYPKCRYTKSKQAPSKVAAPQKQTINQKNDNF